MVLDACYSSTGTFVEIVNGLARMTGDIFTAMMLIVILLVILALALTLPLEASAVFVLPFLIFCYACVPNFTAVFGVTLIYLGVVLANNLPFK